MGIGSKIAAGIKTAQKKYNAYNANIEKKRSQARQHRTAELKERYAMLKEEHKVRRLENRIERLQPQRQSGGLFGADFLDMGLSPQPAARASAPRKKKRRKSTPSKSSGRTIIIRG